MTLARECIEAMNDGLVYPTHETRVRQLLRVLRTLRDRGPSERMVNTALNPERPREWVTAGLKRAALTQIFRAMLDELIREIEDERREEER